MGKLLIPKSMRINFIEAKRKAKEKQKQEKEELKKIKDIKKLKEKIKKLKKGKVKISFKFKPKINLPKVELPKVSISQLKTLSSRRQKTLRRIIESRGASPSLKERAKRQLGIV